VPNYRLVLVLDLLIEFIFPFEKALNIKLTSKLKCIF